MSKIRSDAWLKNLPEDRQDQIAKWCRHPNDRDEETGKPIKGTGGLPYALEQIAADGMKISEKSLSRWFSWYQLRQDFEQAEEETQDILELLKQIDPKITSQQLEIAGQVVFTKQALRERNQERFVEMEKLRLAKGKDEREAGKLKLDKDRFAVATCELFLNWSQEKKATEIANAPISNAEKIAQLRQTYFADVDALEKSGAVQIPE